MARARLGSVIILAGCLALIAADGPGLAMAQAQQPNQPRSPQEQLPPPGKKAPPAKKGSPAFQHRNRNAMPDTAAKRDKLLSELYAHLATAEDEDVAKRVADAIEHVWIASGSDTVNVLIERATKAANDKKLDVATKLMDKVVDLAPDYAEGFARRAYVFYAQDEYDRALGDLRRALALDPNHFKALDLMAQILREIDQKKEALVVYARLLEVDAFWPGAKQARDELEHEVLGRAL